MVNRAAKISFRKTAYVAIFCALAVVSSGVSFPIGPTKVFPFQHAINVVAGIMIGPWYGGLAAFSRIAANYNRDWNYLCLAGEFREP